MFSGNGSVSLMGLARVSRHPQTHNKHLYPTGKPPNASSCVYGSGHSLHHPEVTEFLPLYRSKRVSPAGQGFSSNRA